MPTDDAALARISSVYLVFAEAEAHGRSALYEHLARCIAGDPATLHFLGGLPRPKQQPNLLFAAVKYLYGIPRDWNYFRGLLDEHREEIRETIMARSTQTNEPARCATLLPLFTILPAPLALLEVGASAGLCLLPDRYGYDYGGNQVAPRSLVAVSAPIFSCRANQAPLPNRGPEIIWRAGLDLQPIDITVPEQLAWLEALVWPDEGNRLELLRAAAHVACYDPPRVIKGDLRSDLAALVAQMPRNATRVIFHTAVLGYLRSDDRASFAQMVKDVDAIWISNEPPSLFPDIAAALPKPWPLGKFLLATNGQPIAWTDSHGTSIDWTETSKHPMPC